MQFVDAGGDDAAVLGAFGAAVGVVDESAVAVLQPQTAGAALIGHVPFIALAGDGFRLPRGHFAIRSAPAQLVQPIVVDTEVVGDLVDDRDRDFVDDLLVAVADVQ